LEHFTVCKINSRQNLIMLNYPHIKNNKF